jgi:hypothetical protein
MIKSTTEKYSRQGGSLPDYIRREVMLMTAADIILIFIGIISLLISFGSLIVALLAFLNKKDE